MSTNGKARPTTWDEVRNRPTIPVYSESEASYAGLMRKSKSGAHKDVREGRVQLYGSQKRHKQVLVAALRRQLGDTD